MKLLFQMSLVALGSALGGLTRWGVGMCVVRWLGTGFPWGTLVINVTGSLFLGWLSATITNQLTTARQNWLQPDDLRLILAVGFCGAYTTFSTFELETESLLQAGSQWKATLYVAGSVVFGLFAVRLGTIMARY